MLLQQQEKPTKVFQFIVNFGNEISTPQRIFTLSGNSMGQVTGFLYSKLIEANKDSKFQVKLLGEQSVNDFVRSLGIDVSENAIQFHVVEPENTGIKDEESMAAYLKSNGWICYKKKS